MRVLIEPPPLLDEIAAILPRAKTTRGIIFAWGDRLYNPDGVVVPPAILKHEEVHCRRQKDDPEAWWWRYLQDTEFRFREELLGHRAEYRWYVDAVKDRNRRARCLSAVAEKLASPLYGEVVDYVGALVLLRE